MSGSPFLVRKAAVLGAGVMGAQIAAHLANAGVPVVLFDLAAKDGDPNAIVRNAIDKLKKLEPPPLATKDRWAYIDAANYDQNLGELAECDLVIEAISERMDWKKALYEKVAPHVGPRADCRSMRWEKRVRRRCDRGSAESTSSTRRATCTWSS
jgi:3-hydroxyacyl-CoA dehydrogenase